MKKSRKKIFLYILGFFVVAALSTGYFVYSHLGRIAQKAIEYYGPAILGTSVKVGSVDLSPFSGRGTLRRLVIGNPPGYSEDHLIRLDKVAIAVDLRSLTTNNIHILSVDVESPDVVWEGGLSESNLTQVQKHATQFASKVLPPSDAGKDAPPAPPRKFIIDRVSLTKIKATAHLKGIAGVTLPLPDIEMKDLGRSHNGILAGEIVGQILGRVSIEIVRAIAKAPALIGNVLKSGRGLLQDLFSKPAK